MQLSTLFGLARSGTLGALFSTFLGSASAAGILRRLANGPVGFEVLAGELAPSPRFHDALRDWLDIGAGLGELTHSDDGYALPGEALFAFTASRS